MRRARARARVAGSAGFSVLLLSVTIVIFAALILAPLSPHAFAIIGGMALFGLLGAAIFGTVASAIEWRRDLRVEALVHGFNSIAQFLAFVGAIVGGATLGNSVPHWFGSVVFLPVAFGNAICAVVAGSQALKLDRVEDDRPLRNVLSATAATAMIGFCLLAFLSSQPAPDAAAPVIAVVTGATFLFAFLLSCRAFKIVNYLRANLP